MSNAKKILIGTLWVAAACAVLGFVTLSREHAQTQKQNTVPADLTGDAPIILDQSGKPIPTGTLEKLFPAPTFSLIDADEKPFGSAQLKGQVYIARFFFSECPGVCPMMSKRLTDLQRAIPDERIKFVSFTVDPEKDTPQVMREYRDETWNLDKTRNIFLTGTLEQMRKLPEQFHFLEIKQPADHVAQLILIDAAGEVRGLYSTQEDEQMKQLAIDVQTLLDEKPQ